MPERKRRKIINVAGTFEVDLSCPRQTENSASATLEFYELIKSFFPGNEDERFFEVSKMLSNAKLSQDIILFSFPKKVKEKYGMEAAYRVKLRMGEPTRFYTKELMPFLNNGQCSLRFKGLNESEKGRVEAFLERSSRKKVCLNVKEVHISKWKECFGASIHLSNGGRVRMKDIHSLEEILEIIKKNIIS